MKTTFFMIALVLVMSSYSWLDFSDKSKNSSSIGGSTSIPINTFGNTFENSVIVWSSSYNIDIDANGGIFIYPALDILEASQK